MIYLDLPLGYGLLKNGEEFFQFVEFLSILQQPISKWKIKVDHTVGPLDPNVATNNNQSRLASSIDKSLKSKYTFLDTFPKAGTLKRS